MALRLLFRLLLLAVAALPAAAASLDVQLLTGATGLQSPVALADPGDGSGRLFIAQQGGLIRTWSNGALLPTPFLNITAKLSSGGERGLLGLAFHPQFETNGYFFVNYTEPEPDAVSGCPSHATCDWNTVIARYQVQSAVDPVGGDPNFTDPATEVRLLHFNQPYSNHNGGDLRFGPDSYLYISSGDGGSGSDPHSYGQNTGTLLGKLLRIDVDGTPPPGHGLCGIDPQAYAAPAGNPFHGAGVAGCDEIVHVGLRNPWRFSFDRTTGDLFIADVGQGAREEINFRPAGSPALANWGWRCYEGVNAHDPTGCLPIQSYLFPIHDYGHDAGRCSVTGGFRYRGGQYPTMAGLYLFADYCTGEIWNAAQSGSGWTIAGPKDLSFTISAFGEDTAGELYVLAYSSGAVYRIVDTTPPPSATPTPSRTPTITPTRTLTPTSSPTVTAAPRSLLDLDGDGATEALTDGVLLLRWLFDLRGEMLVHGAVADDCTSCTPSEIESHIASLIGDLDVDGNGIETALTDGLLVLRWLIGLREQPLVSGAVGPGCTRCAVAAIEAFLGALH